LSQPRPANTATSAPSLDPSFNLGASGDLTRTQSATAPFGSQSSQTSTSLHPSQSGHRPPPRASGWTATVTSADFEQRNGVQHLRWVNPLTARAEPPPHSLHTGLPSRTEPSTLVPPISVSLPATTLKTGNRTLPRAPHASSVNRYEQSTGSTGPHELASEGTGQPVDSSQTSSLGFRRAFQHWLTVAPPDSYMALPQPLGGVHKKSDGYYIQFPPGQTISTIEPPSPSANFFVMHVFADGAFRHVQVPRSSVLDSQSVSPPMQSLAPSLEPPPAVSTERVLGSSGSQAPELPTVPSQTTAYPTNSSAQVNPPKQLPILPQAPRKATLARDILRALGYSLKRKRPADEVSTNPGPSKRRTVAPTEDSGRAKVLHSDLAPKMNDAPSLHSIVSREVTRASQNGEPVLRPQPSAAVTKPPSTPPTVPPSLPALRLDPPPPPVSEATNPPPDSKLSPTAPNSHQSQVQLHTDILPLPRMPNDLRSPPPSPDSDVILEHVESQLLPERPSSTPQPLTDKFSDTQGQTSAGTEKPLFLPSPSGSPGAVSTSNEQQIGDDVTMGHPPNPQLLPLADESNVAGASQTRPVSTLIAVHPQPARRNQAYVLVPPSPYRKHSQAAHRAGNGSNRNEAIHDSRPSTGHPRRGTQGDEGTLDFPVKASRCLLLWFNRLQVRQMVRR
jgi:hypothetical protein